MAYTPLRQFPLENISDPNVRQSLQWIRDYLNPIQILGAGFQLFELVFKDDATARLIPHNLGLVPSDIIQTSIIGTGTLSYVYAKFTDKNFAITTSGTSTSDPLRVRFLAGRIEQGGAK